MVGTRKRNPIYNRGNKTEFFSFMQMKLPSIGFIFFSTKIPIPCLDIANNCVILPHRSRRQGSWVGDDIMEKAFTWRFGFDSVELRNFYKMSLKAKQRWMSHGYVFVLLCYISRDDSYNSQGVVYTYRREASRCSFRRHGQCEGLTLWNGQQVQVLTLFFFTNLIIDSFG